MDPIGVEYTKAALLSVVADALSNVKMRSHKDVAGDVVEAIDLYVDAKLSARDPAMISAEDLRETPGRPVIGHGGEDGWAGFTDADDDERSRG